MVKRRPTPPKTDDHGRQFQSRSKYHRDRMEPHFLDRESQPEPYKEYPGLPKIALLEPSFLETADMMKLVVRRRSVRSFSDSPLTLQQLASLLWASTGVTRRTQEFAYRAAPSAGGLYPIETYVVVNRVEGLEPGIYHYSVREHLLHCLNKGDRRERIAAAALDQQMAAKAAAVFVWTAVFQRSVWKYRQRAYRYIYLDCGHIAGQLSIAAVALGLGSCNIGALYDDELNAMLGVDGELESAIYMCVVGVPR